MYVVGGAGVGRGMLMLFLGMVEYAEGALRLGWMDTEIWVVRTSGRSSKTWI